MDKITEALKKILPDSEINEVAAAVKEMLDEAKTQLETEYNQKLEEAYAELSNELAAAEKTAEEGYSEAHAIIGELRNRLEMQGEEYKAALDEGYEEAYQMLVAEREKNNSMEVELYEEYDKKLQEMKEYIVDKVDAFLQFKGGEIYEQAKRDVLNDPRMAEHKVALDKIVGITSNYLSDEDYSAATSAKLDEAARKIDGLNAQIRLMEAKHIKLSNDNTKLNEAVRQKESLLSEATKAASVGKKTEVINEQKERTTKAEKVTGRGQTAAVQEEVVIAEFNNSDGSFNDALVLSGIKRS